MRFSINSTIAKTRPLHEGGVLLSLTLVFVGFLGASHVWLRSSAQGPNLDRELDSLIYVSVADSLVVGDGINTFSDHSSALWPPFYSITIALIRLLGVDSVDAGLLINSVAFGLIISWTGIWLYRHIGSQTLSLIATVTVMTSYTLIWLSSNLLSEPLFILLTLLSLAQLGRFTSSENQPQSAIVLSAAFAALASVTRYMGISIILTAVILILVHIKLRLYRRIKYVAIYCAIAITPIMIWMIRNWLTIRQLTGNRSASQSRIITQVDILSRIGDVFNLWVFSQQTPGWLGLLLLITTGLIVTGVICRFKSLDLILPFALFVVMYLLAFTVAFPFTSWARVHDRYISPVYVPVVGVSTVFLHRIYRGLIWDKRAALKWGFVLLVGIGWLVSINRTVRLSYDETIYRLGVQIASVDGYTRNSETVDYLVNSIEGQSQIYSNEAIALYGLAVIHDLPVLRQVNFIHEDTDLKGCLSWIKQIGESDERPYLVYFLEDITSETCNPVELELHSSDLELVTRTSDGVVYKIAAP